MNYLESCRGFLIPNTFSRVGKVVVICFVSTGIVFLGATGALDQNHSENLHCDTTAWNKEDLQRLCHTNYEQEHAPIPLYAFLLLDFGLGFMVCLIYSLSAKPRVDEMDPRTESLEVEKQLRRIGAQSRRNRRIYKLYIGHLAVRATLLGVFLALQLSGVYPKDLPTSYSCFPPEEPRETSAQEIEGSAKSNRSEAKLPPTPLTCYNTAAPKRSMWRCALFWVNTVFLLLLVAEIFNLLYKALRHISFTQDDIFCRSYLLNINQEPLRRFLEDLKIQILQDTELIEPPLQPVPGQSESEAREIRMEDVFVDPVIQTGTKPMYARNEQSVPSTQVGDSTQIKTRREDIFLPSEVDGRVPRKIVIIGGNGCGKTLLSKRIVRDWAQGKLGARNGKGRTRQEQHAFTFIFMLSFKQLNAPNGETEPKSEEKLNLCQLLNRCPHSIQLTNEVFRIILEKPEEVLIIFDGLDELEGHFNLRKEERKYGNNPTEVMSVHALYAKLTGSKLLPGATILTTTRPSGRYSVTTFDRSLELVGFAEEEVHHYVQKFFSHDPETSEKVLEKMNENRELLTCCFVPFDCLVVCEHLGWFLNPELTRSIYPVLLNETYSSLSEMHLKVLGLLWRCGLTL